MAEEEGRKEREDLEAFHSEVWEQTIAPAFHASNGLLDDAKGKLPEFLLHFTDARALISIIQHQTLRVSRARASNDPAELDHGLEVARQEVRRLLDAETNTEHADVKRTFEEEVLASFEGQMSDGSDRLNVDPHICCFTEPDRADEVAHWAMYGRDGAGFALKFRGEALDKNDGAGLIQVLYTLEDQHVHMRKVLQIVWEASQRAASYAAEHHTETWWIERSFRVAAHALGGLVSLHSSMMKGPEFRAEKEWRFIDAGMPDTQDKVYSFEPRGQIIRSYRDVKFDRNDLAGIVVGPVQATLNRPMVLKLLERYGFESTEVTVGKVALRTLG